MDLLALFDRFDCNGKCRAYLEALRWPGGVACLRCGDMEVSRIKGRSQWDCPSCGYHFSVTAGTILQDSHLPLRTWFAAIYLMCESRKGVSANQLKRTLGIGSYQTAWHLCHRIREAMGYDQMVGPTLLGVVEVDETMVGGKIPRAWPQGRPRQQGLCRWRHSAWRKCPSEAHQERPKPYAPPLYRGDGQGRSRSHLH